MQAVNEDYKKLYGGKAKPTELEIVDDYVEKLKTIPSVECIYVRYDNAGPGGDRYIYVDTISDGNLEEVNALKKETEEKIKGMGNKGRYKYKLFLMNLDRVLKMEGTSRTNFRMGLANGYTDFLYDKHGYFVTLRNELVNKAGYFMVQNIHKFEHLGELDTDKQAHIVFQRSLKG